MIIYLMGINFQHKFNLDSFITFIIDLNIVKLNKLLFHSIQLKEMLIFILDIEKFLIIFIKQLNLLNEK